MRIALLIPVAILAACGSPGTSQDTQDSTTAIGTVTDAEGRTSTLRGAENKAGGVSLPSDLPGWAKIYPGAKVVAVLRDGSGSPGGTVSLVTADPVAKVAAFYDKALAAAGKKPGPTADSTEGAVRFVGKDAQDGGGMVTIAPDQQLTAVTLIYQK